MLLVYFLWDQLTDSSAHSMMTGTLSFPEPTALTFDPKKKRGSEALAMLMTALQTFEINQRVEHFTAVYSHTVRSKFEKLQLPRK